MRPHPFTPHPVLVSVVLAAVVCLATIALTVLGVFDSIELRGYDLLVAGRGAGPAAEGVLVVDFDEASVRALNAFPIPRDLLLVQKPPGR